MTEHTETNTPKPNGGASLSKSGAAFMARVEAYIASHPGVSRAKAIKLLRANGGSAPSDFASGTTADVVELSAVKKDKQKVNQLKRLVQIRTDLGISQQSVAEALGTTQQTIARWEKGQAEPSLAQLRDLAIYFGVGLNDLLETRIASPGSVPSSHYNIGRQDRLVSGFWGHIGVLLPGEEKSRWYPITAHEYDRLFRRVQGADADNPWISVSTLSNRELVINVLNVNRIWFLDDNADQPDEDWEYVEDQAPLEFFNALYELHPDHDMGDFEASDKLKASVVDFVEKFEGHLECFMFYTKLWYADGRKTEFWGNPYHLYTLSYEADSGMIGLDGQNRLIHIVEGTDRNWDCFIPDHKVAMFEIPLVQCNEGWTEYRKELDEELGDE